MPAAIRVANDRDVPALVRVINAAYRVEEFFVDGDRTDEAEVRERLGRGRFLALDGDDGALAACVWVELRGERGYFGMLSVDPARQGRGLGRRLVGAAEEACRLAGCVAMDIVVVNLREELPPFYNRLGYVEAGTRPYPDRTKLPCHFILMSKPLVTGRAS